MKEIIEKISKGILSRESFDSEKTKASLEELGFLFYEKAWEILVNISKQTKFATLFPDFFPKFMTELFQSFDPDMALNNFERFTEIIYDKDYLYTILNTEPPKLKTLITLFSGSQFLSDILFNEPSLFDWLMDKKTLDSPRFKDVLQQELGKMLESAAVHKDRLKVLRRFRKKEYLRIGLRDLLRKADFVETVEDLSNLADVCLQGAYEFCNRELAAKFGVPMFVDQNEQERVCEFVVLGMGKLGGRELNFSSDIDLICLYSSDKGGTTGIKDAGNKIINKITNHEYCCRLAQMITSAINDVTEDGFVFRVDLRLRPEGKSGDIAGSLRAYETYYESWGEMWERQALIKARPVAGNERLGREFLSIIRPFVYKKYLGYSYLSEIKDMKERIDQNALQRKKQGIDVKLGAGGIREIEFLIQAIQMIYGGRERWLQERNSLRALHKISEKGILTYREFSELSKAYIFLRELENRIQVLRGVQVHELPREKNELFSLGRKMGFAGESREKTVERLMQALRENQNKVRAAYENLFYKDSLKPYREELREIDIFSPDVEEPDVLNHLKEHGFRFPEKAYKNLMLLHEGSPLYHPTPKSKQLFRALAPFAIRACSKAPDPDLAINNLERFISISGSRRMYYTLFKEQEKLMEGLLTLFGSSEFLSNILMQQPDLIYLFDPSETIGAKKREELSEKLSELIKGTKSREEVLDQFRRFKKREELRIGIARILKKSDFIATMKSLTDLADICLLRALEISIAKIEEKYGSPTEEGPERKVKDAGFAIIGLGKLGGRELDFGSDLDVVFVYSKDGLTRGKTNSNGEVTNQISNSVFFTRVYEEINQVIAGITRSGFAYKIDARLRPDGTKGMMTVSFDSFKKYLTDRAETWEKQAFIKARFIAGEKSLGGKVIKAVHHNIYKKEFDQAVALEMKEMRRRIEEERGKEREGYKDAKLGYGGILDIEFIVQFLQLKYGGTHQVLRETNTLKVLEKLKEQGLISEDVHAKLEKAYRFLRELVFSLRIENERPLSSLPEPGYKRDILARRLRHILQDGGDGEKLFEEYSRCTTEVRVIYKSVFDLGTDKP